MNVSGESSLETEKYSEIDIKEHEITQNYLAGKLSFSEYAAQMKDEDTGEDEEEETMETVQLNQNIEHSHQQQQQQQQQQQECDDIKPPRARRVKRILPPALKGLMGEANLRYARGDHKTAEKMCLEIIRQIPTAPDPFLTLAQIYEQDNLERSVQFALIAAHLTPNDDTQWTRLATLSEKLGNMKQADTCYAKAIAADLNNIQSHLQRIKFLETRGEQRLVRKAKMRALTYMNTEHHEILIPIALELTKLYHTDGDITKAYEALDFIFKKCNNHVTNELVNMMLELMLALKKHKECLEVFVQHCNIDLELEVTSSDGMNESVIKVLNYHLPKTLPIDLLIKFIICLVHLKSFELLDALLKPLLIEEEGVERNGDLYLDVAEALMKESRYHDALKLLVPLVKTKNFGLAAVWLRHAECLNACNMREQAIDSYKTVMKLAPMHIEMRYPLAKLLTDLNRKSEALSVLEQDETCEEINPILLYNRCKLLKELKLYQKYWNAGLLLLSRHCFTIRDKDEVERLTFQHRSVRKGSLVKLLRVAKGELIQDSIAQFSSENEPSVEDEFILFRDLVETCMKKRRYDLMQRFAFTASSSKRFKEYQPEIELILVMACIFNDDCFHGYNIIRHLLHLNLSNKKCWNLYNMVIQRTDDGRHNRFLMRLISRMNLNLDPNINILHGNNCLVAGTYKYALSEYINLYRIQEDPLVALLIGITLLQIASQKFSTNKDYLVLQGAGFFNTYKKLRGPDGVHEADYNIARGYHQLGLLHLAMEHYKKVLKVKNNLIEKYPNLFDLKKEAAYNLHLIYKASGAHDLAKMYLYKYIIV